MALIQALLALVFLAATVSLVSAATFQQISVPPSVGTFIQRSRGTLTKVEWTQSFNYVLAYGAVDLTSQEHLNLIRIQNGTLYRRLANTTFQLEQYGFALTQKAFIGVPPNALLDVLATARTRGAVALVYLNTTRGFNTSLGTSDQPFLNLNGGNSNGSLSDLTLQLFFDLVITNVGTPNATYPDGYQYRSDPKFAAFGSGAPVTFAREGHTGASSRAQLGGSAYARLYYFGGKNSSMWFNTLYYQEPSTGTGNAFQTVSTFVSGSAPSPRAYHGMAVLDSPQQVGAQPDRFLLIWGGETGVDTYSNDGPHVYDISANTWTDHAASGAPAARMGHALVTLGDLDVIYIFGGMSGPSASATFYNDLWSYTLSTRTWTQLLTGDGLPFPGGAEILPSRRAFMQVAPFDATTFIFFGGENQFGPQNDFWTVNVNVTCPYYCAHPIDEGFKGACMDYQQCHFIKDCSWDPALAFQCFLDCNPNPSDCNARLAAFTCPTGLVKCWSGFCQERIENCKPYPACEPGERRCDNGDCKPEFPNTCTPIVCQAGLQLCADGTCQTTCMPSYGCLPDDKPVQCGDGTCKASSAECNAACASNISIPQKCWYDCQSATSQCGQPYWTDDIHLLAFTQPSQAYYRLYRKEGVIEDPQDLRGIVHLDQIPPGFNLTIYMKSAFNSELREVGPHPTWPSEFDSSYLRSLFVKTNVTNVLNAYAQGSGGINIIFRMKLNEIEKAYWAYHPGHGLGYIAATNCIAYAEPWFWDDMDLAKPYALENISYIKAYRDKMFFLEKNPNLTYTGPEPVTPKLRWRCQLREPDNAWPRFTNVSDDILDANADRYVGIRILGDFQEQIMGIIYAPFPIATPPATAPVAILPPPNKDATYVVIALAAILLLVLVIIVLYKTFGQRN